MTDQILAIFGWFWNNAHIAIPALIAPFIYAPINRWQHWYKNPQPRCPTCGREGPYGARCFHCSPFN